MISPICVVSADWHLERNAWAKYPTLCGDAYEGLKQVISYCLSNNLPLIAAGDLFDEPNPDSHSVWLSTKLMDDMKSANLGVFYIQGQHEKTRDTPWLSITPWCKHVHKQSFKIADLNFYGLDFTRADDIKIDIKRIPTNTDVLVSHQVWYDLMGKKANPECALADIPYVKCIISGDYHSHLIHEGIGNHNQLIKLVSPGPLCMQAINEEPNKRFFVMYNDMTFRSIRLMSRPLVRFRILNEHDLENFLDSTLVFKFPDIPEIISTPIYDIAYDEDISEAHEKITNKLSNNKVHLFLTVLRTKRKRYNPDVSRSIIEKGLEGCLELLAEPDTDIYNITLRLLQSNNPLQELETISDELLITKENNVSQKSKTKKLVPA